MSATPTSPADATNVAGSAGVALPCPVVCAAPVRPPGAPGHLHRALAPLGGPQAIGRTLAPQGYPEHPDALRPDADATEDTPCP
jgi:hypothetical protein